MSSNAKVLIQTRSGKWSKRVTLDDSLFSDILAPLIELGDVTHTVVLGGSVAEVIEEEWDSLQILLKLIEEGGSRDEESESALVAHGPSVPLSNVSKIVRILNLPEGWWMHVSTTRTDPDHIKHLSLVAGSIGEVDPHSIFSDYVWQCTRDGIARWWMWNDDTPSDAYYVGRMMDEMKEGRGILLSVLRNDKLLDEERSEHDVHWETMLELAQFMGTSLPGIVTNTLLTLSGKGDMNKPTIYSDVVADWWGDSQNHYEGDSDESISTIYNLALKSVPGDVHPDFFGLDVELEDYEMPSSRPHVEHPSKNAIINSIPFINEWILYKTRGGDSGPANYEKFFDMLYNVMGRYAVERISSSISIAMDRDPTLESRWREMLDLIEYVLRRNREPIDLFSDWSYLLLSRSQ